MPLPTQTKVLLIMTDGVRPDAIVQANTPTFDALIQRGSHTLSGRSVVPSITLPCHLSIVHSVPPSRHNTLWNLYTPMARPIPALFEVLNDANKKSAMFYSWEPLRDIARPLSLAKSVLVAYNHNPEISDDLVLWAALPDIKAGTHDFTFLYFGATDEVGHLHGWMSQEYLRQVEHTDALLAQVLETVASDTHVIVLSDHGGHDRMHGTDCAEDMTIPIFAIGPGIAAGTKIAAASLLDIAPSVCSLLGVTAPQEWEGQALF